MPLIEYPSTLPPPAGYPFAPRERRAMPQGAGDEEPRARSRDAIVDADTVRWRYSPAEMEVWRAWHRDTLLNGQLWFAVTLPGRGGWLPRVARYIGEQLQLTHLGAGNWEVSCRMELRGLSAPPQLADSIPFYWDEESALLFTVSEGGRLASESSSLNAYVYSQVLGSGKRYIEIELVSGVDDMDVTLGIVIDGELWSAGGLGIRDAVGDGLSNAGSNSFLRGSDSRVSSTTLGGLIPFYVTANRIGIAVDLDARKMWMRNSGGYGAGANPETGAAPTFSGWAAGQSWRIFASTDNDIADHQLRLYGFSDDTYLYGPPAGFVPGGA